MSKISRFIVIGAAVAAFALAFAYTGGWLSPQRLSPARMIAAFEASGSHPGFRRNHAKGLCVSGYFEGNGAGSALSTSVVFQPGRVPVIGRFALAGGQPFQADTGAAVRSLALRFALADGEEWRTGMNAIPVFPFSTPEVFYEQLVASRPDPATGKPDPTKMSAFFAKYPQATRAIQIIGSQPNSSGFANSRYNSLNAFVFVNASGVKTAVRWAVVPNEPFAPDDSAGAAARSPNYLFENLILQLQQHALQWHLVAVVAQEGDAINDASQPWPVDRPQLDLGTLTLDHAEGEATGACRDVNFDPLVLPTGIEPSDDPLLSARSATYSRSFTLREGEAKAPSAVQTPAVQSPAQP